MGSNWLGRTLAWDEAPDEAPSATLANVELWGGPAAEGIVSGTMIGTEMGWRPVDALMPGDRVMTFDGGLMPVLAVHRQRGASAGAPMPRHLWPLLVPRQVVGNRTPMTLLPEQLVLIESDTAEAQYGDAFVLIPAVALEGFRGIEAVWSGARYDSVSLGFAAEQMVYCAGSALLHCPGVETTEPRRVDLTEAHELSPMRRLSLSQARAFLAMLKAEDGDNCGFLPEFLH